MNILKSIIIAVFLSFFVIGQSFAEVGVTDACQKDIKDLEDDIKDDRDDYTAESVAKARAELAAAKTNRLNPAKCRKNIHNPGDCEHIPSKP